MNGLVNKHIVDVADFKVSRNSDDILITGALGSCVAVAVYDPQVHVGGLLHFILPHSSLDEDRARYAPAMFADTGIPLLLQSCYAMGCHKKRMTIRVAGGATVANTGSDSAMGRENVFAVKKIFSEHDFPIEGEDTGDNCIRCVHMLISDGGVMVRSSNRTRIVRL